MALTLPQRSLLVGALRVMINGQASGGRQVSRAAGSHGRVSVIAQGAHSPTKATEPGCLQFDILIPHQQADTICLHEVYADEAAFDLHNASQTLAHYKAQSEPLLLERSIVWCTVTE